MVFIEVVNDVDGMLLYMFINFVVRDINNFCS